MALAGTLKDFSLADIFQLIALQKKTGYLTLRNNEEVVTVTFLEGNVVGAESLHKRLEDRLGHVLVKSGRITKEELTKTLEIQKQTLQRLGYILVSEGFVDPESLKAALTVQMQQTVYRLFRWKDGEYHFEPHDNVEYDRENVNPMAADGILMEGIRMLDEWPLIEKKIPDFTVVFEKVPLETEPVLETRAEMPDFDEASFFGEPTTPKKKKEPEPVDSDAVRLTQEEMAVYQHVNGVFTVQEIIDRSGLNEFETCKALFELLNRQLIKSVAAPGEEEEEPKRLFSPMAALIAFIWPLLLFWILISVVLLPYHPLSHLPVGNEPTRRSYDTLFARIQLEKIQRAIFVFEMREGRLPTQLKELSDKGYIPLGLMSGPFGGAIQYKAGENSFTLFIPGPNGGFYEDLSLKSTRDQDR